MTHTDHTQKAREMTAGFREELAEWKAKPFAEITDTVEKDEIRAWVQRYIAWVEEYDPDWHYITLGETTTVTERMKAEGRAIFNTCTGVWLSEVYGATLERDDLMGTWRMPHADWIRHEANRLDTEWLAGVG